MFVTKLCGSTLKIKRKDQFARNPQKGLINHPRSCLSFVGEYEALIDFTSNHFILSNGCEFHDSKKDKKVRENQM